MLDVCFSDSMKGALRYAQHCGNTLGGATAIGVIGQGKLHWWQRRKALKKAQAERRELEKQAISLGGTSEDVLGLSFNFSCGDIAAPLDLEECPRKQFVFQWLTADTWEKLDEMQDSSKRFWQDCLADLEKLKTRASKGEPVRIWADATPSSACGLLFTADLLRDSNCQITIVPLPYQYKRPDGVIIEYCGWAEVVPELFGSFLNEAIVLSKECLTSLAEQWRNLQNENAPLRVVKGETVVSANEDYYDELIRQEYPKDSCRVAELIGNVLGRHCPGISDWLIAQRIRMLISNNELQVCQDDPVHFYNTVITRTK